MAGFEYLNQYIQVWLSVNLFFLGLNDLYELKVVILTHVGNFFLLAY